MLPLLLCLGLSLAQDPASASPPDRPPSIELVAPTATLVTDVTLTRWPDADAEVTSLPAGTEVEVVYREGDKIRIRKDLDFGWVPADAVGAQTPSALPDHAGGAASPAEESPAAAEQADGATTADAPDAPDPAE